MAKFKETGKLLTVITTEDGICKVAVSKRSTRFTLAVVCILRIHRGYELVMFFVHTVDLHLHPCRSCNIYTDRSAEERRIISERCLQYGRYTSPEKGTPAPAAQAVFARYHLPPITAVSKQLCSETCNASAPLSYLHLTDETHKCLFRSGKIKI